MNRAMILPATIAAGLHVALLGFKSAAPAPVAPTEETYEPIVWQQHVPPPPEEEIEVFREETESTDLLPQPERLAPRGREVLPPDISDPTREKIVVKPSDYVRGESMAVIPSGDGPGSRFREVPIDALFLDNVPRAVFRHAPTRPPGTGTGTVTVTVDFVVGKDGSVTQARIVDSSNPDFEDPCLRAVKRWRFEPGLRKNVPVAFRMQQTFVFKPSD